MSPALTVSVRHRHLLVPDIAASASTSADHRGAGACASDQVRSAPSPMAKSSGLDLVLVPMIASTLSGRWRLNLRIDAEGVRVGVAPAGRARGRGRDRARRSSPSASSSVSTAPSGLQAPVVGVDRQRPDSGLELLGDRHRLVGGSLQPSEPADIALWAPGSTTRLNGRSQSLPAAVAAHLALRRPRAWRRARRPAASAQRSPSAVQARIDWIHATSAARVSRRPGTPLEHPLQRRAVVGPRVAAAGPARGIELAHQREPGDRVHRHRELAVEARLGAQVARDLGRELRDVRRRSASRPGPGARAAPRPRRRRPRASPRP